MSETYRPELLPTLMEMRRTWTRGGDYSLWDFINFRAGLELGYAFASLFWPQFVRMEGGIFLSERFSEANVRSWLANLDGDMTKVEKMVNHVHVSDLFMNDPVGDEVPFAVEEQFAHVLAACWKTAAADVAPNEKVMADSFGDEGAFEITLWIERTSSVNEPAR